MFGVADRRVTDTTRTFASCSSSSLERIEALYDRGEDITGVPTGYLDLDELLSGLQPSTLVIVGARPAWARRPSLSAWLPTQPSNTRCQCCFSRWRWAQLEITQRLLCSEALVESTRLRNGKLLESDWPKITAATSRLGEAPLYIDDNPNLTIMEIRAKARRLKSRVGDLGPDRHRLPAADVRPQLGRKPSGRGRRDQPGPQDPRPRAGGPRGRPLPAVQQPRVRADKRPMLADLRESGSLEQDADVVMFLYRDEVYNPESPDRGTAEVHLSKHRNGPTGGLGWPSSTTTPASPT